MTESSSVYMPLLVQYLDKLERIILPINSLTQPTIYILLTTFIQGWHCTM